MSDELKPPKKIYLQMLDEDGEEQYEITWCEDEINDTDIAYVLAAELQSTITAQADLIRELREDAERWHRQQAHPCLDFLTCCEMENRHNQLMAKIDKMENSND